jgi:predicted cupin superfamily sugar epimerase
LLNDILPDRIKIPKEKLIKTVFLSQIGKVFMFKENPSEWHRLNQGKLYVYNQDDKVALRVGERSVYYATKYGISLEEDEYQAIINLDKDSEDKMAKWHSSIMGQILKQGFELALIEEKYGK